VADAGERARLWPLVTADHKNYADYQTKTDREIPLVLLEPTAGGGGDRGGRGAAGAVPVP
ncbi:MAG: nitroreductase family deazaflavin-dependent oxidoreductase, partial [Actinomycetota bacterium]|nr:nitroreductase family deazaflavin-dependent oxidoreductase [Actinomycetota bacterium]